MTQEERPIAEEKTGDYRGKNGRYTSKEPTSARRIFRYRRKKYAKALPENRKVRTFALANGRKARKHPRLGYGVMVTLQILVLPFLVRIRVP
ncbi:MAG: hypothetical protein IJV64_00925, partial [Oscillospiraceae bacterium]|nr:hypothetical protein [Oscillospiraceae bacterium]